MESESTLSARARLTIGRIQEALQTSETASVTQVIELIETITAQSDTISVAALSEVIARDLTTMFKVIRMANTLAFNPEGTPITTISQAIHVVGFEKIRTLAVSLLLLENAERRSCSEESRGVAAIALASGLTAQTLAAGVPGCDPEQAFVCGALRSYGKLLLTTFLTKEYRQAESLSTQVPIDDAYREVFGLTPAQLGLELLEQLRIPSEILDRLRVTSAELSSIRTLGPNEALTFTSEFGLRFCELIASPATDQTNIEAQIIQLARQFSKVVSQEPAALVNLLHQINRRLQSFSMVHGAGGAFSSPFMRKLQRLSTPVAKATEPHASNEQEPAIHARLEEECRSCFLRGMSQITELLAQDSIDLDSVWDVAAHTIKAGLKLRLCWVLYQNPATTQYYGHFPKGQTLAALQNRPLLSGDQKSVFDLCLARGEAVLIQNPQDSKIQPFLPDWFKPMVQSGSFVLLPVKDRQGVFAIISGHAESTDIWNRLGAIQQELKMFCNHLSLVRRLSSS